MYKRQGFNFNGDVIDIEFSPNRVENPEDWLFWQGEYLSNYTVALALNSHEQLACRVKCFEIMPAVSSAEVADIFCRAKSSA